MDAEYPAKVEQCSTALQPYKKQSTDVRFSILI